MNVGWQRAKNGLRNAGICGLLVFALLAAPVAASAADNPSPMSFVKTSGTAFTVDGKPFFVTGVNNHYLTFGSQDEVTRVLDDAVAMGANVVRTFLQPSDRIARRKRRHDLELAERGRCQRSRSQRHVPALLGPARERMAINDGANGMQKVDFLIAEAGKRHLRLIIAFLDFWTYTGGAQQMRAWYGSSDKSGFFFEDPRTKRDYRTWVSHVVQRVNPLTGLAYRDDPTIMAWELMNEGNAQPEALRLGLDCRNVGLREVARSQSSRQLGARQRRPTKLSDLTIPTLDFGTWHGYPLYYKLTVTAVQRHDHRVLPAGGARQEAGPSGGIRLCPLQSGLGRGLRHVARHADPRSQLRRLDRVAAGVAAGQRTLSGRRA